MAAKSQQGAREVHAELAPYFRPPILPRYQNVSDITAANIAPLSQNAMEVQRDSDVANQPVANNHVIASVGVGNHVGGGGGFLGTTNVANPPLSANILSVNTTTQPSSSSSLPSHSQSQNLQLTQQQQQQPDQDPYPTSPYRSDSAEEQYIAEQVQLQPLPSPMSHYNTLFYLTLSSLYQHYRYHLTHSMNTSYPSSIC